MLVSLDRSLSRFPMVSIPLKWKRIVYVRRSDRKVVLFREMILCDLNGEKRSCSMKRPQALL